MKSIRPFLILKIMTTVAVATLFMTTTTSTPAIAILTSCPCDFLGALSFANKEVKKVGGKFVIEECEFDEFGIEAEGGEEDFCRIELEAEFEDGTGPFECGYEFQCGELEDIEQGEIDVGDDSFALAFDLRNLSEAEFEACRKKIKFISEWIFRVKCRPED